MSAIVAVHDIKLYNFCKSNIGSYSRRELRDFFLQGNILVNGNPIRKGHDDETMRLSVGDVIQIIFEQDSTIGASSEHFKLDQLYEGPGFCIFDKPSGCSVTEGKEYEVAIRSQLWTGSYKDTSKLLYRPEKSIGGLCVATQNHDQLVNLRRAMVSTNGNQPNLTMTYQAVVCGWLGEVGDTVNLTTGYPDCPSLSLAVVKHCRCRSANFLSLVNITPVFTTSDMGLASIDSYPLFESETTPGVDKSEMYTSSFLRTLESPLTNADNKLLNHPTRMLKAVRCALMRAGHGIVGDRDLVKSGKGLYAALMAINLDASLLSTHQSVGPNSSINTDSISTKTHTSAAMINHTPHGVSVELPTPEKFLKLMEREQRMWAAAHARDQLVLEEHRLRHSGNNPEQSTSQASAQVVEGMSGLEVSDHIQRRCSHDLEEEEVEEEEQDNSHGTVSPAATLALTTPGTTMSTPVANSNSVDDDTPVEYITGEGLFLGRYFHVSPAVMIPRRSSGALVKEALRLSATRPADANIRVLDLGTGSGCLLLSAVLEIQAARSIGTVDGGSSIGTASGRVTGVGLDISPAALEVTASNVHRLGLTEQITLVEGSFETLLPALTSTSTDPSDPSAPWLPFDLILCNPPYSSVKDKSRLSAASRRHEPAVAIFAPRHRLVDTEGGTENGTMGAYYMIARSLTAIHHHDQAVRRSVIGAVGTPTTTQPRLLIAPGAQLILEMGHGQETDVRRILTTGASGWQYSHSVRDHMNMVRCVVFEYKPDDSNDII